MRTHQALTPPRLPHRKSSLSAPLATAALPSPRPHPLRLELAEAAGPPPWPGAGEGGSQLGAAQAGAEAGLRSPPTTAHTKPGHFLGTQQPAQEAEQGRRGLLLAGPGSLHCGRSSPPPARWESEGRDSLKLCFCFPKKRGTGRGRAAHCRDPTGSLVTVGTGKPWERSSQVWKERGGTVCTVRGSHPPGSGRPPGSGISNARREAKRKSDRSA